MTSRDLTLSVSQPQSLGSQPPQATVCPWTLSQTSTVLFTVMSGFLLSGLGFFPRGNFGGSTIRSLYLATGKKREESKNVLGFALCAWDPGLEASLGNGRGPCLGSHDAMNITGFPYLSDLLILLCILLFLPRITIAEPSH